MTLREVRGQATAIETLGRALESGRAHHAYRFEGPEGVGKELTAFGLAQALVCTAGDPLGCGVCSACERTVKLRDGVPSHPDVVVVERGLYSADVLGRETKEGKEISVDQIRKMVLAQASFSPHEGRARVFIVRRADELSTSAANALLKTLEEPRERTHFVLITARPNKLLATIRSRTMPLRFGAMPDALVRELVVAAGIAPELADEVVPLSEGSPGGAIAMADGDDAAARRGFIDAVLACLRARTFADSVELAEAADKDRESLRKKLEALAAHFSVLAKKAAATDPRSAGRRARAYELATTATTHIEANGSTSLTMMELLSGLRRIDGRPSA